MNNGNVNNETDQAIDEEMQKSYHNVIRQMITNENEIRNQRTNWFLVIQGFLVAGCCELYANKSLDEIFFNDLGQLCEGARTNIVLKIGGRLYTPPKECGLLGGIMRAKLLERGACAEKILYSDDLAAAEKIYCLNSVAHRQR